MMNRVNLAKSLVAARRIEAGEVIDRSAVDIKSPGRGLQPNTSTASSAAPPTAAARR